MANNGAVNPLGSQVVSPFPIPPTYARNYTTEAVESGKCLPPPPVHADFIVFGEEYHLDNEIIQPLSSVGIRQLYSNKADWKNEMKKLNRSALAAFMDMIEMLVRCPDHPERVDKLGDIRDIFINMHHLVNEFRPVQARDTLRMMQEKQLGELEQIVKDFKSFMSLAKKTMDETLRTDDIELIPVPEIRPELEGVHDTVDSLEKSVDTLRITGQTVKRRKSLQRRRDRDSAMMQDALGVEPTDEMMEE